MRPSQMLRPSRLAPTLLCLLAACSSDSPASDDAGNPDTDPGACFTLADGRCVEETFANPPVLAPNEDGVYELSLGATEVLLDGKRHCVRSYNGMVPGPTIETPVSDGTPRQVRINLRNTFTGDDYQALNGDVCTCTDSNTGMSCSPGDAGGGHGGGHGGECECVNEDGERCHMFNFNLTNLHGHGAHAKPDFVGEGECVEENGLLCRACDPDADNGTRNCFLGEDVLTHVVPGTGRQYRWDIDADGTHHEGMNWYHPHIHGSTAIQVQSGAAGAWIVRGPVDELPDVAAARERVLIYASSQIGDNGYVPLADGEACTEDTITFNSFVPLGDFTARQTNFINGIRQPRLVMAPGQIERWRLLQATALEEVFVALVRGNDADCNDWEPAETVSLVQYARDGLVMPRPADGQGWPYAPDYMFMSPGYRIEAFLDGSTMEHGDTYCLIAVRFAQDSNSPLTDGFVGMTAPPTRAELLERADVADVLAIVNVTDDAGPATTTEMPDLAAIAALAPSAVASDGTDLLAACADAVAVEDPAEIDQVVAFQVGLALEGTDTCGCSDHNVNCQNFERVNRELYPFDRVLQLGALEHWRVYSLFDGHPFHIHINPYFVCPLPAQDSGHPNAIGHLFEPSFGHWRDTYLVNLGRYADVLTEYRTYTGAYVFHCHKLTHEDHGMMELMTVCDPATDSCDTLCDGGRCAWNACAEGDTECQRQYFATRCVVTGDCGDAPAWCTACGDVDLCPAGSYCSEQPTWDGVDRCVPGCEQNSDCAITEACAGNACVPVACESPCPPPTVCVHGSCETPGDR